MAVNRSLYKQPIYKTRFPPWQCGQCGQGTLQLAKGSFKSLETSDSKSNHQYDAWEPEWIELRFICFAQCSSDSCREIAAVSGSGAVSHECVWDPQTGIPIDERYEKSYTPDSICPAPMLFVLSNDLPAEVKDELLRAFGLFWNDRGACVNALRSTIEASLDSLRVNKTKRGKGKGKRRRPRLSLDERIGLLPNKYSSTQKPLLAAKWIGNAGTHGRSISQDDVFDALDLVEHSLNILFDGSHQRIQTLARKVTTRRKPVGGSR